MQFSTFAVPTIEGEIKRHLRDTTWHAHVPRGVQENHLRVQRTREGLAARLGRSPDLTELTEATGLTPAEIREADTAAQARTSGSLEPGADESTLGLVRRLGDSDPELEKCEALIALKPALARLDDRERTILELRFGAELTQKQIGRHLGISQMHVSRILNRILDQLRPALLPTN
ncbi:sigma-70 family RNA polymerase sigma factor [Streptacidiphilus monticola]